LTPVVVPVELVVFWAVLFVVVSLEDLLIPSAFVAVFESVVLWVAFAKAV
jgi:hypothetical protein